MNIFNKQLNYSWIIILLAPQSSNACSSCMLAHFDKFLPPIGYWLLFANVWFLTLAIYSQMSGMELSTIPRIFGAIVFIVVLAIAGVFALGPISTFIILLAASIGTISLIFKTIKIKSGNRQPQIFILGCIFVGLVVLTSFSVWIRNTRSDADFYMKWGGTHAGKMTYEEIILQGSGAHDDLRRVISKGDPPQVAAAAKDIIAIAIPPTDVPLILEAFQRCYSLRFKHAKDVKAIESVLRELTGFSIPDGSSPKIWYEKWNATNSPKDSV